jgi:hypothetical protein
MGSLDEFLLAVSLRQLVGGGVGFVGAHGAIVARSKRYFPRGVTCLAA